MSVHIVACYAGLFGIAYVVLSLWVVAARNRHRVALGSGGQIVLERRVRVHANFAEYVPFTLLLAMLAEAGGIGRLVVHAVCLALLVGRLLHAWAVSQTAEPFGRVPGMVLTLGALGCAALAAAYEGLAGP